jgi:hypothetical protein
MEGIHLMRGPWMHDDSSGFARLVFDHQGGAAGRGRQVFGPTMGIC